MLASVGALCTRLREEFDSHSIPWILATCLVLGAVVVVLVGAAGGLLSGIVEFLIAGAALLSGALVGFIFGIPKSRTDTDPGPPVAQAAGEAGRRARYTDNTNLEEVSDWLTKIIVGLGLVEFSNLVTRIQAFGDTFGAALSGQDPTRLAAGAIIAEMSLIYFLLLGFLFTYRWTRVEFRESLDAREQLEQTVQSGKEEIKSEISKQVDLGRIKTNLYNSLGSNTKIERSKRNLTELEARSRAANLAYEENPGDRQLAILTSRYINEILSDPKSSTGAGNASRNLDRFVNERRQTDMKDDDYADVLFNRAAYNTRIYDSLRADPSAPDEQQIQRCRKRIMEDLSESISIKPDNARDANEDEDFTSLWNDADYEALVRAAGYPK